jgi:hypothetical protein
MLKSWKLLAAGFGVIVAGLLWFTFNKAPSSTSDIASWERKSPETPNNVGKSVASVPEQKVSKVALPPRPANRPELVRELESVTNLSSFQELAKTRVAEGGYYMAALAGNHCSEYSNFFAKDLDLKVTSVSGSSGVASVEQRLALLKKIKDRCANVGSSLPLVKEGIRLGDPIIKLERDLSAARLAGEQLGGSLIAKAFATNNGYAVEVAMIALQSTEENRILFNNSRLGEDDSRYLRMSMQLIPCGFGMDCGPDSMLAVRDCVISGTGCDMNRFEQIQGWNMAPREWERVMYFYNEMSSAYRNGNFSIVSTKIGPSSQLAK